MKSLNFKIKCNLRHEIWKSIKNQAKFQIRSKFYNQALETAKNRIFIKVSYHET